MFKILRTYVLLISITGLLFACGESDSGTASAPAESAAMPEKAMAEATMAEESMAAPIEKAEGVIYQDEIYANWPYN